MYTNFMRPSLGFMRHHMTEYVGTVNNNLTQSHFNIYSGFFGPFYPTRTYEVPVAPLSCLASCSVWQMQQVDIKTSFLSFDYTLDNYVSQCLPPLTSRPPRCQRTSWT